ncbi:extracellular solute-binding protein [Fimbriimonas ginsengisoli]|uniref:Sugar ABC transporter permease n=1 Tax=Fimbriimonas ginsengisoli Gsoil 348 TaxID=661478 RepID=A0A068NQW1_FIMGI|nr:extracellular solute-binding protein [Fimbriimonas ginsengisoli]AIE85120.1 sugar ABC transporter permease [Fimbriimonas ginsengisoli Gsoil 348]
MRRLFVLLLLLASALAGAQAPTEIRMMAGLGFGIPPKETTNTNAVIRRSVFEAFHKANPDVRVVNAGGLSLEGQQADNMFLMSMAGDRAPDIFYVNFRQYYTFLEQGFCRPLDDLIKTDPAVTERINPTVRQVLTSYDGRIYAIPFFQVAVALYYRKDFFREAGLDPARPPRNWDEFYEYAKKLTKAGRFGFELSMPPGYQWQNFVYQAGGEIVGPAENGRWKSLFANEGAAKAIDFYRRLVLPQNGVPPVAATATDLTSDINKGKTAMWFSYTNDVVMQSSELPPSLVGIAALPAGPAGARNEVNAGMWAISSRVTDPKKLDACWRFIKFFAGDEAARANTQKSVEMGLGPQVNPIWLKKFGYDDLLGQVDQGYVKANESLFQTGHPEPYGKNCQQIYTVMDDALDRARLEPETPAMDILRRAAKEMDQKLLGYIPPEDLQRERGWALGIAVCFVGLALGFGYRGWQKARRERSLFVERLPAGISRRRLWLFLGVCLAPAVLSIATWSYYPLAKGLLMAFQDYRIMGGSRWVGLDNFIGVFSQPVFYRSIFNAFLYVGLSLAIGFFLPVFLALALNEIPRGRTFFRTVFYLPAMTSSVVVSLVWRQFYDKTDQGLLNSLLAPVITHVVNPVWTKLGHPPVPTANDWLGSPALAMFSVVLPGIWAGAGAGSILYLAALKNISSDRYEAADLDGASWWQKIRYITLPGLKPLILINLLGVFIAGFKAMENVFLLTQGGPLNATRTIGLEIWQNAFMFLKFGYATAAAWVMGSILIGFTLIQIRTLLRMRFSTAKL